MSNLIDAYNMVKKLNVSTVRAAKIFNVPVTTLQDRVNNKVALDVTRSGPGPVLCFEEECKLTTHWTELANIGYRYTQAEITRQASNYAIMLGKRAADNPLSSKWYTNYKVRCPESIHIRPILKPNQKIVCTSTECVSKYYDKLDSIVHEYEMGEKPENIYLMDEIDIDLDTKAEENCGTLTVVGAGNAVGQIIPPYFIMVTGLQDEDNIFMRKSQLITKGFKNYLSSHFMKYAKREDSEYILLLYDGHRSHLSVDLIDWAKENNIILFVIPPQKCCIVKTRNVGVFEPLKSQYNEECSKLDENSQHIITSTQRTNLVSIAKKVYETVVTPVALKSFFSVSGVYPLKGSKHMCELLEMQKRISQVKQ